jgi:hypothetical protein
MDNSLYRPMVPRHRHAELSDPWVPERRPPVANKGDAVAAVAEAALGRTATISGQLAPPTADSRSDSSADGAGTPP